MVRRRLKQGLHSIDTSVPCPKGNSWSDDDCEQDAEICATKGVIRESKINNVVQCRVAARVANNSCSGKATMHSLCVAELHVAVNYITITFHNNIFMVNLCRHQQ
jgi:hypothetical protein